MLLAAISSVSKSFGDHTVFKDASFQVHSGECVAVFGPNGCGKSTMLKMIIGQVEPDSGHVWRAPDLAVGYLPQSPSFVPGASPRSICAKAALPGVAFRRDGLGDARAVADATLRCLGITQETATRDIADLSCGERTRAGLAQAWCSNPDLIVLDEPTNHLDIAGLELLAEMVRAFRGAVVIVSHDRYFLDRTATRIIELSTDGTRSYPGNYTKYLRQKQLEFDTQMSDYVHQERKERQILAAIARQQEWGLKAHSEAGTNDFWRARAKKNAARAKATIARLNRMRDEGIEKPRKAQECRVQLGESSRAGRRLVYSDGISMGYDHDLFSTGAIAVMRGERIGIVGPNGAGKSTLLKGLLGLLPPRAGHVWISPSVSWFYYDQAQAQFSPADTAMGVVTEATGRPPYDVRSMLGALLLRGEAVDRRIATLSLGERVRVDFARMVGGSYSLLALDEPTNNLDIQSREAIEGALEAWDGTLLIVSHDRYLLNRLCTKIVCIEQGILHTYPGRYCDFELSRKSAADRPTKAGSRGLGPPDGKDDEHTGNRLLLENRLAVLSARLSERSLSEEERTQAQHEFMELSRALARTQR
ncbi:MAG: ABC-F family ATP-binding cassette domain-containing protein [Clostridia bacterium]|nr:ABC-F family ATP-binding cassette domain-containing protein [Clostridia bacterium]